VCNTPGTVLGEQSGRITSLAMLATEQPMMRLASGLQGAHCWFTSSFSSTRMARFFSAGLLSVPQSVLILGIAWTLVQDLALSL